MAVCGNCQAEGTRIRTVYPEKGVPRDECPQCAPQSFEKFTMPSDQKIWMGYEAHPNEYVKAEDGGFDRKPEYRAEQEQRLAQSTDEERTAQERAVAEKRATRRTHSMDAAELATAMHKAEEIAVWMRYSAKDSN